MTNEERERRPLLSITTHDPALEQQLRGDLRTLRDRARGTELAALLDDVLQGRRELREVARTETFGAAVAPATERVMQAWAEMPQEERDEFVAEGQRQLEEARAAHRREQWGK